MKTKLTMALVPLLLVGCGKGMVDENHDGIADGVQTPDSVTVVAPATPMGTVSGQVLSTRYAPLEGADVTMTIGGDLLGSKAVTDATGSFSFEKVPAGSRVLLTFSKPGFVTARASAVIPSQAGNVPINNANASFGPVLLPETNGTVRFQVYAPDSRPATGARATLVVSPAADILSSSAENIRAEVVVQGTVDAQGILSFGGVPSPEDGARLRSWYTLYISPMDTNADGIPDVDGEVRPYDGQMLLTGGGSGIYTALTIQLQASVPTAPLSIKYASLGALRSGITAPLSNMVSAGESISVAFNKPIQTGSLVVGLTDEYGRERLDIGTSLAASNTLLTLTPGATLLAGREYNLYLRAVALNDGTLVERTVAFVAGDPANPPADVSIEGVHVGDRSSNGLLDPGETVYLSFSQVLAFVGGADGRPAQVFLNQDLDGSGRIDDAPGEKGNAVGFNVTISEPTGPNPLRQASPVSPLAPGTGYSTRLAFVYGPSATSLPALDIANLPELTVKFAGLVPGVPQYQTGWGLPQSTNLVLSAPLIASPYTP